METRRLTVVLTDPKTGLAYFATIAWPDLEHFDRRRVKEEDVVKKFGENANHHHPSDGEPILLTIVKGSHRIFVPADPSGTAETCVTLNEGDIILFLDFEPEDDSTRTCPTGHRSEPGPNGAVLRPELVLEKLDLGKMDWQPLGFA